MRPAVAWATLLTATLGCAEADFHAGLDVELSEVVPTVASARWQVEHDGAEATWLEAAGGGRDLQIPVTLDGEGNAEALVLGMKAGKGYDLRVVEVVGGEELRSETVGVETGGVPAGLAELDSDGSGLDGYLVTSIATDPSSAVIIDADGDYVWWHQPAEDWKSIFIPRVAPSQSGDGILYEASTAWIGDDDSSDTIREMLRVAWDGAELQRTTIERAHHDLVELPDGTVAIIRYHTNTLDDVKVEGDRIVEIRPDGEEVQIWSIWDHEEYDPDVEYGPVDMGWSHCNALDYDADEDVYYIGSRHLRTIYKVDRDTGDVVWRLGGLRSDFTFDEPTPFACQHQFEKQPGGMLVFDNGCPDEMVSRAAEFALDEVAGEATLVWSHEPDPEIWSYGFGDVARLPTGETLITWSTAGQIDLVTPDGQSVWRLNEELGGGFGYTTWMETLYP